MQSSFRSCKWPGSINVLLGAGTANLLAGIGENTTIQHGRAFFASFGFQLDKQGEGGGEGLCLLTETLADKENFIARKIFRHTFMFQQDLLGSLSCDSTSIQTIYLFTYDKASHGRAYQHFSLCHFLSVRGC